MEDETVKIEEEKGRGTRGGPYFYVAEGNTLVHISEYAIRTYEYEDKVVYEVLKSKVTGKVLYCFNFSRSGGDLLGKCRIEDFEDGRPKKFEYYESLNKSIGEIRNLRFQVRSPKLMYLLTQFEEVFIPMIYEVKEYEKALNFDISFMGHQARLEDAFKSPDVYYFTFMSLPKDESRIRSLKVTRRWIYQIWVLKLLCNALRVSKFKGHEYEGKPYWWIEQGSEFSTAIGETPYGYITFWLEFQLSKYAHMLGMFTGKHEPTRPDIVAVKGYFELTEEFINLKKPIDLIIECKEDPFDEWKKDINSQIIPYQERFKPKNFIVVSLEHIPDNTKKNLESRGIKVIDKLKPHGESIKTFYELIEKLQINRS
jgi:hypothetical protein